MMKVRIINDNEILEGTPREIVEKLDYRASEDHKQYMSDFAKRYKLYYGDPLFYHNAKTFIKGLNGVFLEILEEDEKYDN